MAHSAGVCVWYRHRLSWLHSSYHYISLEWHIEHMGAHRTLPVRITLLLRCIRIRRSLNKPAVVPSDTAGICCGSHVAIYTAGNMSLHCGPQLAQHMVVYIYRVTALAQGRTGVILVVN